MGIAAGASCAVMSDRAKGPQGADRRQSERRAVDLPGKILFDGGERDCAVYDISPEGALASAVEGIAVDHAVRLKVTENGEFLGLVVWLKDGRMGLKFMQFEDDGMRLPPLQAEDGLRKVS